MSPFQKFDSFALNLLSKVYNFASGDVFKVMLTNTPPSAGNAVFGDLIEIAAGNGYPAGGLTMTVSASAVGGVGKVTASNEILTASGGSVGPFQWAVVYDSTPGSQPLVGWADYGGKVTLNNGEPFTIMFDSVNGLLAVL